MNRHSNLEIRHSAKLVLLAALMGSALGDWVIAAEPPKPPIDAADSDLDPIRRLKPGEWYEVPDSHLDKVAPTEAKFPWLRGNVGGVTACWAGGAFDSQRDRLYIGPGGGHAGYNGNEVYAFDLNDLKWHRLNDPDPVIPGTEYTDLNVAPFAMHTYDGVAYLPPPLDRYVVVGGWGTQRTYALDPDHPDHWEVYADHGTARTGDISAYDPIDGIFWLNTPITSGKLSQWNPLTRQWTLRLNDSPKASYYETADIDWKRRLMVSCGKGLLKTWTLTSIPGGIQYSEIKSTGPTEIIDHPSPGFCYVPVIDQFVGWASGADVYTLDMDAKTWTKHPPAASNTVVPGPPDQWGTFGRFRYVPSKNVFVLYNAVKQNVFVYKLTNHRPNVITGVEATLIKNSVDSNIPAAAIAVHAVYADKTRKLVTDQASYFSIDPAIAEVDVHGRGKITGLAPGTARIRAVYSDPAFNRGFSAEVRVPVKDIIAEATLNSIQTRFGKLTIVAGDTFGLQATSSHTRGTDHFTRQCTDRAEWSSDSPSAVSVANGVVKALRGGGPVTIKATLNGKSDTTEITVVDAPVIQRINFQVKDAPPRAGWNSDNGQPYTNSRGFGWLNARDMATRDDRGGGRHPLLKSFVLAKNKRFRIKVPAGPYVVRIAMGDTDYGAVPFEEWISLGTEKLIYYEGHHNNRVTRIVQANDDGLLFTVNGHVNYIIAAPVGIDMDKYANDGMEDNGK